MRALSGRPWTAVFAVAASVGATVAMVADRVSEPALATARAGS